MLNWQLANLPIAGTEPRKLFTPVRSRSKHTSNGIKLTRAQMASPRIRSVPGGSVAYCEVPLAPRRTIPPTEPSASTRPSPDVPSKQVNENRLPTTKLRASSAPMFPASAGTAAKRPATAKSAHTVFVILWTRDGRRRSLGIRAITCRRVAGRSSSAYGPLDRSRLVARTGRRLVARRGRRRGPEAAGPRGQSRPADLATHRSPGRVPEVAGPLSRPADRVHRGRSNVRDAVRSPGSSRNRYSHSAIPGRTPRVAAEGFRARCQPRDLPAVRRHTGKTQPPQAELARHYTGEPRLALPEQRALGEARQRRVASRHTGAVRPLEQDRRSRRPPHQKIRRCQLHWQRQAR